MTTPLVIRNVLFATDFSDASPLAGQTAAEIARHFEARLHILHVIPLVTDPTGASEASRAEAAELERGLSIVTACTSGRVARRIVECRPERHRPHRARHARTHRRLARPARERGRSGHPPRAVPGTRGPCHDARRGSRCPQDRRGRRDDLLHGLWCRDTGRAHLRTVPREDPRRGAPSEAA